MNTVTSSPFAAAKQAASSTSSKLLLSWIKTGTRSLSTDAKTNLCLSHGGLSIGANILGSAPERIKIIVHRYLEDDNHRHRATEEPPLNGRGERGGEDVHRLF